MPVVVEREADDCWACNRFTVEIGLAGMVVRAVGGDCGLWLFWWLRRVVRTWLFWWLRRVVYMVGFWWKRREKRLPMETSCSWGSDGVFLSKTLWGTRAGFRVDWVWFFWASLARNRLLVSVSCRREKVPVLDYFMRAVLRLVEMEEWNRVLMTFEANERWSLCVVDLWCGVVRVVIGEAGLGEMKFEYGSSAGIENEDGGWRLTRMKEMSLIFWVFGLNPRGSVF